MFHIKSSLYINIFFFLMCLSLSLVGVYETKYSMINDTLERDAINKENITLLYLQSSIKKENTILNSVYSEIENKSFNKAAIDSMMNTNNTTIINDKNRV